jgi:hypothetical protein
MRAEHRHGVNRSNTLGSGEQGDVNLGRQTRQVPVLEVRKGLQADERREVRVERLRGAERTLT